MKSKLLLRISAGLSCFFAIGHTIGHFTRKDTTDPVKKSILQQMDEHAFDYGGSLRSLSDNYEGMSLFLITTLVLLTILLWQISSKIEENKSLYIPLLIPIMGCFYVFAVLSTIYFFMVPAITCFLTAILISFICIRYYRQQKITHLSIF
ncbi:hypothetical protein QNI19_08575 [Cytophagaceae bacterium DM2B3-1]|uniref:Uncharacterized protein n=1 Tax=Xanthocytophaga flava TaxID=3048013 RepID=A0ABT7CJX9_9BACT|nr:hypothetical protein [Xanthocytophaga flavus]MDJ1471033.1 hypothetical protein [Xanthocytophaga flavus]MDJ1492984.1 hypothetical protein [Xanthocytophaga flavus]